MCNPHGKLFSLVPRVRSSVKIKVKYQGNIFQKIAFTGALVFHRHNLCLKRIKTTVSNKNMYTSSNIHFKLSRNNSAATQTLSFKLLSLVHQTFFGFKGGPKLIFICDPSREKGPYRNCYMKIIKTETKQAQADTVRQFQSDNLAKKDSHLIHRKSANSEKFRPWSACAG